MFKARDKKNKGGFSISLNIDGKTEIFEFIEPNFEAKVKAAEIMMGDLEGSMHLIKGGAVIVDSCYKGELVEIKKDEDVYLSLCTKAASLVTIYEGELKKN
jgi:hypothetical protein